MAGTGPAPKPLDQRRNHIAPKRGEWVDLAPLAKPALPTLPKREKGTGRWAARSRTAWAAWRNDPVTAEYAPADVQAVVDLIFIYEEWVRGKDYLAGEIRQRQDRLGLNPKGKRDLRWRVVEVAEVPKEKRNLDGKARIAHLTVVG